MEETIDQRFRTPFLPPRYLSRPRLLDDLEDAGPAALTVLSAGAGAGKTLLLAEWTRAQDKAVPWLALTPADDDPRRFWRLFLEALRGPGMARLPLPEAYTGIVDVLDLALASPAGRPDRSVIVLDDAHLLTDPEILAGLDRVVRRWSHRVRLVLAARSDPLLPLHRYRLADQMRELRAADLAMNHTEAGQLLRLHGVRLADKGIRTLANRTEGWPAGLRLAALRMEHLERADEFVALLAMDQGSIGEYLTEEVLTVLPPDAQRLLVETSFLDDLTGPLAGAVTGIDDCHTILADLARSNSFVVSTDPARTTFRCHQLFGEMLRQLARGQPADARRGQYVRAARWFRTQGDWGNALRFSVQGEDLELARAVLLNGGLAQMFVARDDIPRDLLRTLSDRSRPDEAAGAPATTFDVTQRAVLAVLADRPAADRLAADRLAADRLAADRLAGERPAADRPAMPPGAGDPVLRLVAALTDMMLYEKAGHLVELDALARQVLSDPVVQPVIDATPGLRARMLLVQAQALFGVAGSAAMDLLLRDALTAARAAGLVGLEVQALALLAYLEVCACRFRHAGSLVADVETALAKHTDVARPVMLDLAVARRALVTADFTVMAAVLRRVTTAGFAAADVGYAAAAAFLQARLLLSMGELAQARGLLRDDPAVDRSAVGMFGVLRDRELAKIELAQGRPRSALQILGRHRDVPAGLAAEVTVARAYLALGDPGRAEVALRAVTTTPSEFTDRALTVEAALCDAEIAQSRGDEGRAAEAVDRALLIADDEIVLPFVESAVALDRLLVRHPALASRWPAPARAAQRPAVSLPHRSPTPENLTHREAAVLRLMVTSMSTAEIAGELCLSVNTIKTHLAAIYRKLSVSRRREAVHRARELELI